MPTHATDPFASRTPAASGPAPDVLLPVGADPALAALARRALVRRRTLLHRSRPRRARSRRVTAVAYPVKLHHRPGRRAGGAHVLGIAVAADGRCVTVDARGRRGDLAAPLGDLVADPGRRTLGLTTPPPPAPIATYAVSAWLDRVLDEILATDPGTRPPWPALSARHPLAAGRVVDPHELCARTDALPHGWETLRRAAASAALAGPVMSSALAAWFDEGSFARHLLSTTGDGAELLADVLALLAPADAGRVLVAVGDHLEP